MKKKLLLVGLIIVALVCMFAVSVSAESSDAYIEFKIKLTGQDSYVAAYSKSTAGGSIPQITFTDASVFLDNDFTQSVNLDDIIGVDLSSAVTHNCGKDYVESVKLSKKLSYCEEFFWLSSGQTSIPMCGFDGWTNLKRFDLGCATYIDGKAFNASGLESIVLPSTIKTLKFSAFYNCKSLKSVKFECAPETVESTIFYGCSALTSLDLGPLTKMGESMFENCTSLTSLTIPSTYNGHTNKNAFKGCTSLKSVHLGGITYTGESMFANCTSLTDVTVTSSVGTFNGSTFAGCTSLTSIELPSSLKTINSCTFEDTGFVYFKMPDTVTTLGYGIFQSCESLQYVELSNTPGLVRDKMFNGCKNLKAVSIPEGITKIESMAFYGCTSLKAVYLPSTLTQIGSNTNWNQGAFSDSTNIYFVSSAFSVKDENGNWLGDSFQMPQKPEIYYMPSGLTTIYGGEFQNCKYMNPTIVFPKTLTSISYANGPFVATAEKQNMTYIFLGDMEAMGSGMQGNRYKNISLVFANKNDTSLSSIETWSMADIDKGSSSNFIAYFCASEVSYDMGSLNRSGKTGTYTVNESEFTKTEYTDVAFPHIYVVSKNVAPSCDKEGYNGMVCFCGAYESKENVVPATHDYGKELSYNVWVWENDNYFANANYKHTCQICAEEYVGAVVANSYLFIEEGFATFANKEGETIKSYDFQYSIKVNTDAMDNYTAATGKVINYGTVAGVGNSLTNPISYANGTLSVGASAAVSDMTGTDYVKLLIKVTSIPVLEKGVEITCNAYAIVDDKLRYVGETTVTENAQSSLIK